MGSNASAPRLFPREGGDPVWAPAFAGEQGGVASVNFAPVRPIDRPMEPPISRPRRTAPKTQGTPVTEDSGNSAGRAIPSGRLARLGVFGRLAGGVAGGVVAEGARRLANGERPQIGDLLLTPANATRVADQLSHLRGAAMKLGQMISMDAGDMLPPELADHPRAPAQQRAPHAAAAARPRAGRRMGQGLAPPLRAFRGAPDRRRLDRPGPPRAPARRPRTGDQGPVSRREGEHRRRRRQRRDAAARVGPAPQVARHRAAARRGEAAAARGGRLPPRGRRCWRATASCSPISPQFVVPDALRRAHHAARAGDELRRPACPSKRWRPRRRTSATA